MLSYEDALEIIIEQTPVLPKQQLSLENLLGHVLADDLRTPFDMPSFSSSAVDGYGVFIDDLKETNKQNPTKLKLIGKIKAGSSDELVLTKGSAIKILTGAIVPSSVEAVVMQEFCEVQDHTLMVNYAPQKGENIRPRGAEFPADTTVTKSGVRITPPIIGLIAASGYNSFTVHTKPKVAIITNGDELTKPGNNLVNGKIYDANSYALKAALDALGIPVCANLHTNDSIESISSAFEQAINQADLIISTGGVSVGEHDYIRTVLDKIGINPIFWQIAVKPGRPVYFGINQKDKNSIPKLVFGLPGNPVSALVTFHQLVKPAIFKMMGLTNYSKNTFSARLKKELNKPPGRLDLVRGIISDSTNATLQVEPTFGQESHMLSGLAKANCLIHFDAQLDHLESNKEVIIDLLNWYE